MMLNRVVADRLENLNKYEFYPMEDVENVILRLNANENFLMDRDLLRRLAEEVLNEVDLRLYPNIENVELIKVLSRFLNLGEDSITVGSGEDQLIDILLNIFAPEQKIVSIFPTFPVYRYRTIFNGGEYVAVPLKPDFSLDLDKFVQEGQGATLVILCSPNNPTGNQFPIEIVREVVNRLDGLVVVDEAYVDFAKYSVYSLINEYKNLIVLRTFSKSYGLAGLRIGYMIANPKISKPISTVAQLTYPIVNFSARIAIKLLQNRKIIEDAVDRLKVEREKLYNDLKSVGVEAYKSEANFILFRSPIDPDKFYNQLYDKGVMIRNIGKIFGEHYFRVTVGTGEMNQTFFKLVKKIVSQ
jgi:histidinol-phosphate aminotransferase